MTTTEGWLTTLKADLARAERERHEAVKRLNVTIERWGATERERDEARVELLSIAQQLELEREASAQLRAELGERMRETAEAQREACARRVEALVSGPESAPYFVPLDRFMAMGRAAEAARSAALVTDTKADGGTT